MPRRSIPGFGKGQEKRGAGGASRRPTNGFRPEAGSEGDEIVGRRRAGEVGRLKRVSTSKAFPFPFPRGEGEENSSWAAVFSLPTGSGNAAQKRSHSGKRC